MAWMSRGISVCPGGMKFLLQMAQFLATSSFSPFSTCADLGLLRAVNKGSLLRPGQSVNLNLNVDCTASSFWGEGDVHSGNSF